MMRLTVSPSLRLSLLLLILAAPAAAGPPSPAPSAARRTSVDDADRLGLAAFHGDVEGVRAMLAAGVDPNVRGSVKKTPLRMATSVACGDPAKDEKTRLAVVDALITGGAKVNEVDDYGSGLLMMAAQKCKGSIITRMLKAGADTEQRSPQGFTPLSMALLLNNVEAATALVDHGARLSAEAVQKVFPDPPDDPALAALLKRATAK